MNAETRNAIIALAREEAAAYFPLQLEADIPQIDPDEAWETLNWHHPDNAALGEHVGPTEMDRLFELAYRQNMARRWLVETTRRLEELNSPGTGKGDPT